LSIARRRGTMDQACNNEGDRTRERPVSKTWSGWLTRWGLKGMYVCKYHVPCTLLVLDHLRTICHCGSCVFLFLSLSRFSVSSLNRRMKPRHQNPDSLVPKLTHLAMPCGLCFDIFDQPQPTVVSTAIKSALNPGQSCARTSSCSPHS
jgi:hypothetical protein